MAGQAKFAIVAGNVVIIATYNTIIPLNVNAMNVLKLGLKTYLVGSDAGFIECHPNEYNPSDR